MTTRVVHRPARSTPPAADPPAMVLASPPQLGDLAQGFPIASMLPIVGSLASVTMIVVLRNNPIMVVIGAVILVVALGSGLVMALTSRGAQVRQRRVNRERYLDYLERTRAQLRERSAAALDAQLLNHPDPALLWSVATDPMRRWERRPHDPDFLRLRIGTWEARTAGLSVAGEENPLQPFDPIMVDAAENVEAWGGLLPGAPACLRLTPGEISIVGARGEAMTVARAMLAQLTTFHSPDEVQLAFAISAEHRDDWGDVDLLPHTQFAGLPGDGSPGSLVAHTADELAELLRDDLRERVAVASATRRTGEVRGLRRLVVILDVRQDGPVRLALPDTSLSVADLAVSVIHLVPDRSQEPPEVAARVVAGSADCAIEYPARTDANITGATYDPVTEDLCDLTLRAVCGLRLAPLAASVETTAATAVDMADVLGVRDIGSLDVATAWAPRQPDDFLRVPIGLDDQDTPVLLDLKESAQQGMGPHGICIGATGSGKSELLRTLVLELALTHSPDDVTMVLVDFKGGAAFSPFARLPHVAGIIDNLADDAQLTQRARESINGEVIRRQRLLKSAGDVSSIGQYRRLRETRPDLAPMPHLLLVIDEFGELLTAEPDFVDLLLTIGRIGRSIGVHLLLSSQRIEAGKLRGLDTYLSYRIGLRTFSEAESRVILETPDAFHLPSLPGFGYLKVDTTLYERFRAGYVSGPVPRDALPTDDEPDDSAARPRVVPRYYVPPSVRDEPDAVVPAFTGGPDPSVRTTLDVAVDTLAREGRRTRPVWLPPLPSVVTLGAVLPASRDDTVSGGLRPVIGLIDDPTTQFQGPWNLDLTRAGGHVSIVGAPGSGRSTFLRTLTASLALTHTPREVNIYGMDLTGGGLSRIEQFPHVGGVATRGQRERLERLVDELGAMLSQREVVFRDHRIDSIADLRRRHAAGEIPELAAPDIVLLVDGVTQLRADFEDLEPRVMALLERGSGFGLHVVVTLGRANDIRMSQQALIGTRVELNLNDPGDSQISRKLSETLRSDEPGRVLTDDKLFAHIALPLLDQTEDADLGAALEELARDTARRYGDATATPIRLLPDDLDPAMLPEMSAGTSGLPVGLRQDTMAAATVDFDGADPHLLVFGDSGCGKTTLLRGVVRESIDRESPEDLVIALMDNHGELVHEISDDYLGGHAPTPLAARKLAEAIAVELHKRQDEGVVGPRILVIADDYDVLAAGGVEPLRPLLPYLASARQLRLHLVLARPVAGASRAMYDPAIQSARDAGGSTVIMSGDRGEGPILPRIYADPMIPGRGRFVRRAQAPQLIQVAHFLPRVDAPVT